MMGRALAASAADDAVTGAVTGAMIDASQQHTGVEGR